MKKKKIVYKVIKGDFKGNMVSCYAPDNLEITYKLGKRCVPKIGKIFCFKTFEDADNWADSTRGILRCETDDFIEMDFHIPNGGAGDNYEERYKSFWKSPRRWATYISSASCHYPIPKGTVFCNYVKPLEIVK